jgi:hypothetical protein
MSSNYLHEDLSRQSTEEKSSERGLGITFGAVFFIIGAVRLYRGHDWWIACLLVAAVFVFLAYFWTAPLRRLNNIWHRFGLLLFHIVNPLIMGIVFYLTIFPIGVLMRLFGKDPLRLKLDHEAQTYWQARNAAENLTPNMKNQY